MKIIEPAITLNIDEMRVRTNGAMWRSDLTEFEIVK
jgi:hypothetical protein